VVANGLEAPDLDPLRSRVRQVRAGIAPLRRVEAVDEDTVDHADRAAHTGGQVAVLVTVVAERAERVERQRVLPGNAARAGVQAAVGAADEAVVVGVHVVQAAGVLERDLVVLVDDQARWRERHVVVRRDDPGRGMRGRAAHRDYRESRILQRTADRDRADR